MSPVFITRPQDTTPHSHSAFRLIRKPNHRHQTTQPQPETPPPNLPKMKQRSRCEQAVSQKMNELHALEERLSAASARAAESGYTKRASSYSRQIDAVRRERERWSLLLQNPSPPTPAPHLFAAGLAVLLPLVDLFVAGGHAARRLGRVVLSIGIFVAAIVLGTTPPSVWESEYSAMSRPVPWVREIAQKELVRKNDIRLLSSLPRPGMTAVRLK